MKFFAFVLSCLLFLLNTRSLYANEVTGFWKTINEKNGRPESIIAIYPYLGKWYGRIIATYQVNGTLQDTIYNPKLRAPGVQGMPYYSGMDIIWNLQKKGNKYINGRILDPEHGRTYDAELWRDGDNLVVRGKILFFGRNQIWKPMSDRDFSSDFQKPDLSQWIPYIPKAKA